MNNALVITVLANDRPGIVKTLSEALVSHNASWVDSRMANMADKFAGLVRVSVANEQLQPLKDTLQAIHDADNHIHIMMDDGIDDSASNTENDLSVEVIGADRPGIIDDVTNVLLKLRVNIKELQSEQREASMSSEMLFWAKLQLGLPQGVSNQDVQSELEALSDHLMVDISTDD